MAKIGQGAMGDVYKAHDAILNRHVALKTIAASLESSPDARLRFHREAQSIARLNHPNIVTVYDFGDEQGEVYMAMELLEGGDLRTLIAAGRLGGLDAKLALMEQVSEGVGFAHSMSVIHRDLKPANINVSPSGQVKVMDFGLARIGAASGMTQTGTVLGTPHYMSPEQVRGQKADACSDVFALGAILYEVLTGHQPFEAESMHAVLFRILETEPEPVRRWFPDAPEPVVKLAEAALAKDPTRRIGNGTDMAAALRAVRAQLAEGSTKGDSTLATLLAQEQQPEATHAMSLPSQGSLALEALVDPAVPPVEPTRLGVPTLSGKAPTRPGARGAARPAPGGRRGMVVGAVVVAVAGAVGLAAWGLLRPPQDSSPAPEAAASEGGGAETLEQRLLAAERQLAQASLQDRRYEEAIAHAERALGVAGDDAEALRVRDAARQALAEAEAVAAAARAALEQGETAVASRRLEELLEIQPGHPAVAALTSQLNDSFQPQAEQARAATRRAEAEARRSGASGEGTALARTLSREGETAFGRGEYASATERFLAARDAFTRAGQIAAATRSDRAAAQPTPPPTPVPAVPEPASATVASARASSTPAANAPSSASPAAAPPRDAAPAAPRLTSPPPAPPRTEGAPAPTTTRTSPAVSAPAAPRPPAAAAPAPRAAEPAPGPSDDAMIRDLVADYGRAIESQDLDLFRRIKPNLSGQEEDRLRQAFDSGHEQDVVIEVLEVDVSGATARVRLVRRDVMDGRAIKPFEQVLSLRRQSSGWALETIGR